MIFSSMKAACRKVREESSFSTGLYILLCDQKQKAAQKVSEQPANYLFK